jgi:YCII-related domain
MLIHAGAPDLAGAWDDEAWAALRSWLDETIGSGVSIEGPLRLDAYAETKEQIAGFDVIECPGLEEAVRWGCFPWPS